MRKDVVVFEMETNEEANKDNLPHRGDFYGV